MTGGVARNHRHSWKPIKSSEYITLETVHYGPDLPDPRARHCMVKVNESLVLVTGGTLLGKRATNSVQLFVPETEAFRTGPRMFEARMNHACGALQTLDDTTLAVVAGKRKGNQKSTEILAFSEGVKWLPGPEIQEENVDYVPGIKSLDTYTNSYLGERY